MLYARRSPRLAFALAALGGCTDDDGSETGASTATDDVGAGTTDDGGTTGAGEASTGAPTSADGADAGTPCEPEPVPELCRDYADQWVECIYNGAIPADGIQDGCSCTLQLALGMYGSDCVSALEDYYACIAMADCMSIALGEACSSEGDAIGEICPPLRPD